MRKIFLFMNVSLDGYFEGPGHDISAFSGSDAFSPELTEEVDTVLLGHKTYDLMKAFWPTAQAEEVEPEIARFMNEKQKVVASHSSFEPGWKNATVFSGDVVAQVKELKEQPGKKIAIFGSNALSVSLMREGLIDEFQLVVNPVVLGDGTPLFTGLGAQAHLTLADTQKLDSGSMVLTYVPLGR